MRMCSVCVCVCGGGGGGVRRFPNLNILMKFSGDCLEGGGVHFRITNIKLHPNWQFV